MIWFYAICSFIAFINMAVFLARMGTRYNAYYLFTYIFILISNLGFLASGLAVNKEEYILATKIFYLAGSFIPMLMIFVLAEIVDIKISKTIKYCLWAVSILLYFSILSIGIIPVYYKSIDFAIVDGVRIITKEYGLFHTLYYLVFYGYLLGIIGICIYGLYAKKTVSKKLSIFISLGFLLCSIVFLVIHKLKLNVESIPLIYLFLELILIFLESQAYLSNIQNLFAREDMNNSNLGYIVLDKKLRYCGINAVAMDFFPEFKELKIEKTLPDDKPVFRSIKQAISSSQSDEFSRPFKTEEKYYRFHVRKAKRNREYIGWFIEVIDDTERHQYTTLIQNYNIELSNSVKKQTENIENMQQQIILGMADVVENRDNNTGGHIKRTSDTIGILINSYKKYSSVNHTDQFYSDIVKAAPLHDLGKIAIEDRILRKPGKYTDEEYEIMKTHPGKSAQIIDLIFKGVVEDHFYVVARNIANYHHEKWNGKGYPTGAQGEQIPIEARLMAIVDVYDALVSKRCYKEAMDHQTAYNIIIESMGSHFDPNLEKAFIDSYPNLVEYYLKADNK